jgi:hypothetical protein|tara:strand:+ start:969 stop:1727 length:759 start_codon:yes stop_codon:yes gene_type:complete
VIDLRERRRQLLNLTITEIILILLFLVLLIAANLIQKNKELTKQNEQLTLQNEAYKSLDVDAAQLVQFRKFEEVIKDLKEKNGEFTEMDIEEIISELVLAQEKYKKIKDKDIEIAMLANKLKDYDEAKELLAYYKKRYGNDKPPCWKKAGTIAKPEYLFDAIINDTGIILTNTDFRYQHRINDRKILPVNDITEGLTLSAKDFLDQTKPVYELNKETCRHYLLVKDRSGNNKNHFKKYLSAIEDRFYKYEDK